MRRCASSGLGNGWGRYGSQAIAYPLEALKSLAQGEFSGLRYQHW